MLTLWIFIVYSRKQSCYAWFRWERLWWWYGQTFPWNHAMTMRQQATYQCFCMDFIFCKLKKPQKTWNSFFCKLKKPQKTWISFFASLKTSKNINFIFCKLKKPQKTWISYFFLWYASISGSHEPSSWKKAKHFMICETR